MVLKRSAISQHGRYSPFYKDYYHTPRVDDQTLTGELTLIVVSTEGLRGQLS